jgi:hypothetical protein
LSHCTWLGKAKISKITNIKSTSFSYSKPEKFPPT